MATDGSIKVIVSDNGSPLVGAAVFLYDHETGISAGTGVTDAQGKCEFLNLDPADSEAFFAVVLPGNSGAIFHSLIFDKLTPVVPVVEVPTEPNAPHAYWRLNFASFGAIDHHSLIEVEFRETVGGVNAATGGTPIAGPHEAQYGPGLAFDNNQFTSWLTYTAPTYIGYSFAEPVSVAEYAIKSWAGEAPSAWELEFSDDGSTWATADTRTAVTGWADNVAKLFTVPVVEVPEEPEPIGAHRYWGIRIIAPQPHGDPYCAVGPLVFAETPGGARTHTDNTKYTNSDPNTLGIFGNDWRHAFTEPPQNVYSWIAYDTHPNTLPYHNGYDFTTPFTVREVRMSQNGNADHVGYMPKDFDIIYSDDNVTWENAVEVRNAPAWTLGETRTLEIPQVEEEEPPVEEPEEPEAYTRYRLLITASNSGDAFKANIAELYLRTVVGGARVTQIDPDRITASSTNSGDPAMNVLDGFNGSMWNSEPDVALPAWIAYEFSVPTPIAEYAVESGDNTARAARAPSAWLFQGSHDGSNWVTLDEQTGLTWEISEIKVFTLGEVEEPEEPPYDEHWDKVKLLLDGNDVATDLSDSARVLTFLEGITSVDGVLVNTTNPGRFLAVPAHADFRLDAGDWTLEFTFKPTDTTQGYLFGYAPSTSGYMSHSGGTLSAVRFGANGSFSAPSGETHSWAFSRVGNTTYTFRDGLLLETYSEGNVTSTDQQFALFGFPNHDTVAAKRGGLSDIRFTKGVGRYSEAYTLALPFPTQGPPVEEPEEPATYARYRIYVTASNSPDAYKAGIAQIELRTETGGANVASGGTPTASTDINNSGGLDAFDNSIGSMWHASGALPQWIAYELWPDPLPVVEYAVQSGDADYRALRAPTAWLFQGSNDGVEWVTLHEVSDAPAWGVSEKRVYSIVEVPPVEEPEIDPHWDNVVALLHFEEDAEGGGPKNEAAAAMEGRHNYATTTTNPKFGTRALLCNGSVSVRALNASADWLLAGQFTMEFHFRADDVTAGKYLCCSLASGPFFYMAQVNAEQMLVSYPGPRTIFNSFVDDQWYHLELSRDANGMVRLFIDGVLKDTWEVLQEQAGTTKFTFGNGDPNVTGDNFFEGAIDEIRFTKGVCRHTANFDPPTAPHPHGPTVEEPEEPPGDGLSAATAMVASSLPATLTANSNPDTKVFWVKFTIDDTHAYVMDTEGTSGLENNDTHLGLYGADGVLIYQDDDSGTGPLSRIERTLTPGTYWVVGGVYQLVFGTGFNVTSPAVNPGGMKINITRLP